MKQKKQFRDQWLEHPLLKEWLDFENVFETDSKGRSIVTRKSRCIYCNNTLTDNLNDLKHHGISNKHLLNAAAHLKSGE